MQFPGIFFMGLKSHLEAAGCKYAISGIFFMGLESQVVPFRGRRVWKGLIWVELTMTYYDWYLAYLWSEADQTLQECWQLIYLPPWIFYTACDCWKRVYGLPIFPLCWPCKQGRLTSKLCSSGGVEGFPIVVYAILKLFWSSALQETLYLRRYMGPPLSGTSVPYQP